MGRKFLLSPGGVCGKLRALYDGKQRNEVIMYAVVQTGGKQYRVQEGDTLEIELLEAEQGKDVTLDHVLLIADGDKVQIGKPMLAGAKVTAEVVQHKRGPKLIAFKMKRTDGYRRKVGHRQELTVVKVKAIQA